MPRVSPTRTQEALAKKLRQDKVQVGETHSDHVEQRSYFMNLRTIMDLKLRLQVEAKKQQTEEENSILFGDVRSEQPHFVRALPP